VHDCDWCFEDINAFEKEWPLLGIENREPLIRSDNDLVGFNLGKVRIDGQVDGHARRRNELRRETEFHFHRLVEDPADVLKSGSLVVRADETARLRKRGAGNNFDCAFHRDLVQASQLSFLAQITGDAAIERHP
jgi:hypothetical protein